MTLELEKLITEIRQDYQIPPYFQDTGLMRYLEEGKARLDFLNPGQSLDDDYTFRMLLKNYVYYAYHHKVNEWEDNYKALILSWQMGSEVKIHQEQCSFITAGMTNPRIIQRSIWRIPMWGTYGIGNYQCLIGQSMNSIRAGKR